MNTSFKLQWFQEGDEIPAGSRFIKTEKKSTGKFHQVLKEDWPPYGGGSRRNVREEIFADFYLYEVPLPPKATFQDVMGVEQ